MKKILSAFLLAGSVFSANAQYDQLMISRQDPLFGTARYSAMAGALGALGGNSSVTKDNPAGLGIYRSSDAVLTTDFLIDNNNDLKFRLNNFGLVFNLRNKNRKHGYITSSIGISYNRLKNFSRYTSMTNYSSTSLTDVMGTDFAPDFVYWRAKGFGFLNDDDQSEFADGAVPGKVVKYKEKGRMGEWDFSYGMNISNRVYWGVGLGVYSINASWNSSYEETGFWDNGESVQPEAIYFDNFYDVNGIGANFKVGMIVRPADFLRLGLSFHTPTAITVDEKYSQRFDYTLNGREIYLEGTNYEDYAEDTEFGSATYRLNAPLRLQASAGFVIGKRAVIGLEYNFENYQSMKKKNWNDLLGSYELDESFRDYCKGVDDLRGASEADKKGVMKKTHTLKVGAEVQFAKYFAGRLGFACVTAPTSDDYGLHLNKMSQGRYCVTTLPMTTTYITGGLGYAGKHFYADLSYVMRREKETFVDFFNDNLFKNDGEPYIFTLNNHNIIVSLGVRF